MMGVKKSDRVYCPLPLYHSVGGMISLSGQIYTYLSIYCPLSLYYSVGGMISLSGQIYTYLSIYCPLPLVSFCGGNDIPFRLDLYLSIYLLSPHSLLFCWGNDIPIRYRVWRILFIYVVQRQDPRCDLFLNVQCYLEAGCNTNPGTVQGLLSPPSLSFCGGMISGTEYGVFYLYMFSRGRILDVFYLYMFNVVRY